MLTRDDPSHDPDLLAAYLERNYALHPTAVAFLPLGFDLAAAVYRVSTEDGRAYFLKIRATPVYQPGLRVARALAENGIREVVAPIPTVAGSLWSDTPAGPAVLYPFVAGQDAMTAGLTEPQWDAFGRALRAVHDSDLHVPFAPELPVEAFDLSSAALVRDILACLDTLPTNDAIAADHASFWRTQRTRIETILARAEELGRVLQTRRFDPVLCHADIHAANLLADPDGRSVHLVDWDGPKIAPRERDLLFVVGSTIARNVTPREERLFFDGYGPVRADPTAIAYYRYERAVEDIGVCAAAVFDDATLSPASRRDNATIVERYLTPGGFLDTAETVSTHSPNLTLHGAASTLPPAS